MSTTNPLEYWYPTFRMIFFKCWQSSLISLLRGRSVVSFTIIGLEERILGLVCLDFVYVVLS